jgi:hypothetical protein
MPNQDMINNHIPQVDRDAAGTLVDQIEALIQPFLRNLSDAENAQIGSINESNKLFVNKVVTYHSTQPALDSPDVDWTEFQADFDSRLFYETAALRLTVLAKAMTETRRLHDYDNYQNALIDYNYAKYKDRTSPGVGYDTKVEELGQFFTGGGASEPTPDNP